MNLKDFISATLTQIVAGTVEADREIAELGGVVNPLQFSLDRGIPGGFEKTATVVTFDVAVTAVDTKDQRAGVSGGLKVLQASIGTEREQSTESVSRVHFSVGLALPAPSEEEQMNRIGFLSSRQYGPASKS